MQGIAILPESADLPIKTGYLKIRNHKADRSLFEFLQWTVWYGVPDEVKGEMEQQGIEWYGAAEYMATELEDDETFGHSLWSLIYLQIRDPYKAIVKTKTGQEIKNKMIRAIRNCDSYMDFKDTFEYESKFVQSIKERLKGEFT